MCVGVCVCMYHCMCLCVVFCAVLILLLCLRANVCLKSRDLLQLFQVNILSEACGYLFQCVEEVCEGG